MCCKYSIFTAAGDEVIVKGMTRISPNPARGCDLSPHAVWRSREQCVQAGHLWGERRKKLERLNQVPFDTLVDQRIEPIGPLFAFQHATRGDGLRCFSLPDIFGTGDRKADRNHRWGGGFKTRQDKFTVAFTPDDLEQRITELAAENADEAVLRMKYRLCRTSHFNFRKAWPRPARGH